MRLTSHVYVYGNWRILSSSWLFCEQADRIHLIRKIINIWWRHKNLGNSEYTEKNGGYRRPVDWQRAQIYERENTGNGFCFAELGERALTHCHLTKTYFSPVLNLSRFSRMRTLNLFWEEKGTFRSTMFFRSVIARTVNNSFFFKEQKCVYTSLPVLGDI